MRTGEKHYGRYMPRAGDAERLDAALGTPPVRAHDGVDVPRRRRKSTPRWGRNGDASELAAVTGWIR
jgi:hypothetical protein